MFWLVVVAMAVVVGGTALVALGGGGTLPEAVHDRIAARLPERPLSRTDVDEIRLPMAVRGYRMDEVDDVLDRLGAELALRDTRISELEAAAVLVGAVVANTPEGEEPLPGLEEFAKVTHGTPATDAVDVTKRQDGEAGQ